MVYNNYMDLILKKFLILIIMKINMNEAQHKKAYEMKAQQSDDSSSLQFLGSSKQEDDNNDNDDEMGQDQNNGSNRRPNLQKNQNGYKRKQKNEDQNNSQSIFLYKPGVQLPNLFNFTNQSIKVIIASQYINKDNPSYVKRKIYGNDTYSSNSDCVCIAIHYGLISFVNYNNRKYEGVQITFKVIKPKKNYLGAFKNGLQSQTIKNFNGNALKPQACRMLTNLGSIQSLQKYAANMHVPIGKSRIRPKPQRLSSITPVPQSNLVFNMNNQPAFKYSIYNISDKGFDKSQFFVRKLDNKSLYFQTQNKQRYQLSKYIQKSFFEVYRFSKIRNPIKYDNQYFSNNPSPMNINDLDVLEENVEFDEIVFGDKSIKVKDTCIDRLICFKYYNTETK